MLSQLSPLDLDVGPRVLALGCAVIDVVPAQASSNAWARKSSPLAIAFLTSGTAEPPAPGVVKWIPQHIGKLPVQRPSIS